MKLSMVATFVFYLCFVATLGHRRYYRSPKYDIIDGDSTQDRSYGTRNFAIKVTVRPRYLMWDPAIPESVECSAISHYPDPPPTILFSQILPDGTEFPLNTNYPGITLSTRKMSGRWTTTVSATLTFSYDYSHHLNAGRNIFLCKGWTDNDITWETFTVDKLYLRKK